MRGATVKTFKRSALANLHWSGSETWLLGFDSCTSRSEDCKAVKSGPSCSARPPANTQRELCRSNGHTLSLRQVGLDANQNERVLPQHFLKCLASPYCHPCAAQPHEPVLKGYGMSGHSSRCGGMPEKVCRIIWQSCCNRRCRQLLLIASKHQLDGQV